MRAKNTVLMLTTLTSYHHWQFVLVTEFYGGRPLTQRTELVLTSQPMIEMNEVFSPQDLGLCQTDSVASMHASLLAAEINAKRSYASCPSGIFTITGKLQHGAGNVHVRASIEGQLHQA